MGKELVPFEFVDQVAQTIGLLIEIGRIDLPYIAGENELGIFSCPGNDRLDLMRSKVLRFVHNEDHIAQTSSSDVGQWRDKDLLLIDHLVDLLELLVLLRIGS